MERLVIYGASDWQALMLGLATLQSELDSLVEFGGYRFYETREDAEEERDEVAVGSLFPGEVRAVGN